jgi:hypothetical protein
LLVDRLLRTFDESSPVSRLYVVEECYPGVHSTTAPWPSSSEYLAHYLAWKACNSHYGNHASPLMSAKVNWGMKASSDGVS